MTGPRARVIVSRSEVYAGASRALPRSRSGSSYARGERIIVVLLHTPVLQTRMPQEVRDLIDRASA